MIINNGGNLSKEYFIAYLSLIINSKQCTLEEAKQLTFERLFNMDEKALGKVTYSHFNSAFEELKKNG
ncbi:hypothetical protein P9386_03825 [Caldifermentibacillus hisashii]|nr:hypothetical protein [Caldifermentibacillus hisashii]